MMLDQSFFWIQNIIVQLMVYQGITINGSCVAGSPRGWHTDGTRQAEAGVICDLKSSKSLGAHIF